MIEGTFLQQLCTAAETIAPALIQDLPDNASDAVLEERIDRLLGDIELQSNLFTTSNQNVKHGFRLSIMSHVIAANILRERLLRETVNS